MDKWVIKFNPNKNLYYGCAVVRMTSIHPEEHLEWPHTEGATIEIVEHKIREMVKRVREAETLRKKVFKEIYV